MLLAEVMSTDIAGGITNWALGILALFVSAGFAYLKGQIDKREKSADSANQIMRETFQDALVASDKRTDSLLQENARNRDAFLENTGRITHSIEASTRVNEAIAHKLDTLTDEIRKSSPSIRTEKG